MSSRSTRRAMRARILAANREMLADLRARTPQIPATHAPEHHGAPSPHRWRTELATAVTSAADTLRPVGEESGAAAAAADRMGISSMPEFDDDAQTDGLVVALRGAFGEQRVHALLTAGTLPAPSGAATVELASFGQPAADLIFRDAAGRVIDTANVKIAVDADVIADHFLRWSEQSRVVYASHEAALDAARRGFHVVTASAELPEHGPVVVDTGLSARGLEREITQSLGGTGEALTATEVLEALPWFTYGLIAARAVTRLLRGDRRSAVVADAGSEAVSRTVAVLAGRAAGALATPAAGVAVTILAGQLLSAARTVHAQTKQEVEVIRAARRSLAATLG